jgi:hypothetical protein
MYLLHGRCMIWTQVVVGPAGRPDRPLPTTLLPPRSNSKPEAPTAVDRLLMMGKMMPEACWAVFKRQAINLRDWCIWLVDLFELGIIFVPVFAGRPCQRVRYRCPAKLDRGYQISRVFTSYKSKKFVTMRKNVVTFARWKEEWGMTSMNRH